MVVALEDTQVLAKIDGSDLIAKEMKYHLKCVAIFGKLYIAMQSHDSDLKDFFLMKFNHFHLLYQNSANLIYQPISLM